MACKDTTGKIVHTEKRYNGLIRWFRNKKGEIVIRKR